MLSKKTYKNSLVNSFTFYFYNFKDEAGEIGFREKVS